MSRERQKEEKFGRGSESVSLRDRVFFFFGRVSGADEGLRREHEREGWARDFKILGFGPLKSKMDLGQIQIHFF